MRFRKNEDVFSARLLDFADSQNAGAHLPHWRFLPSAAEKDILLVRLTYLSLYNIHRNLLLIFYNGTLFMRFEVYTHYMSKHFLF